MTAQRIQNGAAVEYWTIDAAGSKLKISQNMLDQQTGGNVGGQNSPNAPTIKLLCACLGVDLHLAQQTVVDLLPGLTNFANTGILS